MKRYFLFLSIVFALVCPLLGGAQDRVMRRPIYSSAPFSPPDVANLAYWFKADALALSDDDPVGTWTDSSGNSRDITQTTSSKKPIYKTSIVNSLPVVRFDGSDDYIERGTEDSWPQYLSFFWVVNRSNTTDAYPLAVIGSVNIFLVSFYSGSTTIESLGYDTGNSATGADTNTMSTGSFHVVSMMRRNGSCETYVDGVSGGSTATSGTAQSGNSRLTLGSYAGIFGFLPGDVAELVVYWADIGTTDRQRVEDYLGSKYAITITH